MKADERLGVAKLTTPQLIEQILRGGTCAPPKTAFRRFEAGQERVES
jgi:hypothetical protein